MESKKGNGAIFKIVLSIIVAIVLFLGLLTIESNMLKGYEKKNVVVATQEVLSGTVLDESKIDDCFSVIEVEAKLAYDDVVTSKDELVGMIVRKHLNPNEIVDSNDLQSEVAIYDSMEEPVKMSIQASGMASAVSGCIRGGDIVDISVLTTNPQECEYVLEDVYVLEALTSDGKVISRDNTSDLATVFTIIVDKNNVNSTYEKLSIGNVIVTYPDVDIKIEGNSMTVGDEVVELEPEEIEGTEEMVDEVVESNVEETVEAENVVEETTAE